VRLAEKHFDRFPNLLSDLLALTKDKEPRVRFQLAFTLGEVSDARATSGLAQIAELDAEDAWIRTAVLSSSMNRAGKLFEALLSNSTVLKLNGGKALLKELAYTVGCIRQSEEINGVLTALATAPTTRDNVRLESCFVAALGEGLRQSQSDFFRRLTDDTSSPAGKMFNQLVSNARELALSPDGSADARQDAVALLGYGSFENAQEVLSAMLEPRQSQDVQLASVRVLTKYGRPEIPSMLLSRWRSLPPAVQTEIADSLLARKEWISAFLEAVKTQTVPAAMIGAARRNALLNHSDMSIRDRAKALFNESISKSRDEVVNRYKSVLSLSGDRARGQQVFERACVTCHRFAGKGNEVGPNLSAYGQASTSAEKLLISILDPNREVAPDYVGYVVELNDGRTLTGIIAAQTPNSITLKQAGTAGEIILRSDIKEMRSSSLSLMPEGFEESIKPEEMADLLAFLMAIRGGI
jgi:putative heme-binding domain-containing protein